MKILLIEDDFGYRATLAFALKRRGASVDEVGDGDSALSAAASLSPDGILLDMRLGREAGIELLPELRRLQPQSRIVVLTGYGSIPGALQALRLGADDYLLKSAGADQILDALRGNPSVSLRPSAAAAPSLARLEWEHIQRVLHDNGGNISHAAEALGIDRRTLQRKLAKQPPDA